MKLIINDDKLTQNDVNDFTFKTRAILTDKNNNILIANFGGVILLPGGTLYKDEFDASKTLLRELKEETGIEYESEELEFLTMFDHYQKAYPKRDGSFVNRLSRTYYYKVPYKGIDIDNRNLMDDEKEEGFKLKLVSLDNIEQIILNNKTDNPRNIYFQKELLKVIEYYKKDKDNKIKKK
jgi:8-oxo-dGTP pyrophosphatase MutT (NUDIX family)